MLLLNDEKSSSLQQSLKLYILPALAILLALLAITFWAWNGAKSDLQKEKVLFAEAQANNLSKSISERMSAYDELVRATAALFATSSQVTSEDWSSYLKMYDFFERYKGSQGVAYAPSIKKENLAGFEQQQSEALGVPFTVHPTGERDKYAPILFSQSITNQPSKSIGFDIYTDPIRKQAMDAAAASGTATLTSKLTLLGDAESSNDYPGAVLYFPVFPRECANSRDTPGCEVQGYTFTGLKAENMFGLISDESSSSSAFRVYDGLQPIGSNLLFESRNYKMISDESYVDSAFQIEHFGHTWLVETRIPVSLLPKEQLTRPDLILGLGLALSLAITLGLYTFLLSRAREIQVSTEARIESIKEDVLSLAAHQLRTPATAVKQYVGMLKEGFAGELTKPQDKLVNQAYKSNERQLHIIDEMLYVANADAGKLKLVIKPVDISNLILDVVDEQNASFGSRKVRTILPKNKLVIQCDELFIRMAIGNILSNAVKYTEDNGKIEIKLSKDPRSAIVRITDNGLGIPKNQRKLLFKKFVRINNPKTSQTVGSGLGLYLAKTLVQLHGGTIKVKSDEDAGSVFTLSIPKKNSASAKRGSEGQIQRSSKYKEKQVNE